MASQTIRVRRRPVPASAPVKPAVTLEALRLHIVYRAPDTLKAASRQARRRGKGQVDQLVANMRRFGCVVPAVVGPDLTIIDGHAICEAAKLAGLAEIPTVSIEHLNDAEIRTLRIALNRISELSSWDEEALGDEIKALAEIDFDLLSLTGFSTPDLDVILHPSAGGLDEGDSIPPLGQAPAISRLGDLYTFKGEHRLHCADALLGTSYRALLAGEFAEMVWCDLPYGCRIDGHVSGNGKNKAREFVMGSGDMDETELQEFFRTIFAHLVSHSIDGSMHYSCIDYRSLYLMLAAGRATYTELKNICTWDKGAGGMGSLYRSASEFVTVWKNGKAKHINNVALGRHGRTRTTVFSYPGFAQFGHGRAAALAMHATVKPLGLVADCILDCSTPGEIICDPTVGSGTTLVAAHRTKRRGFGLELDPLYVDVAVRRMEAFTGAPAHHVETGLTFAELAERRAAEHAGPTSSNA